MDNPSRKYSNIINATVYSIFLLNHIRCCHLNDRPLSFTEMLKCCFTKRCAGGGIGSLDLEIIRDGIVARVRSTRIVKITFTKMAIHISLGVYFAFSICMTEIGVPVKV